MDAQTITTWHHAYAHDVRRFAARFSRNPALAQDACQEAFIRAWKYPGEIVNPINFLIDVAKKYCLAQHARKDAKLVYMGLNEMSERFAQSENADQKYRRSQFAQLIESVSRNSSVHCFVEQEMEDRTYREVAEDRGTNYLKIFKQAKMGQRKLQRALHSRGIGPDFLRDVGFE